MVDTLRFGLSQIVTSFKDNALLSGAFVCAMVLWGNPYHGEAVNLPSMCNNNFQTGTQFPFLLWKKKRDWSICQLSKWGEDILRQQNPSEMR